MKMTELQQALRTADPAAVLVSPRVLDRVIQQVGQLPNFLWRVPHRECFVVDRHILFRHVEQDELDLEPDQLLPPTVILLARPAVERLNGNDRDATLLRYWRRLFHASVHVALEKLTADDVRERVAQISPAEFDEIRSVLVQEYYLLPNADERDLYIEFAALYLELYHFATNLLPVYFPGVPDFDPINRLLAQDVDSAALFDKTRLAGAPAPVLRIDPRSDESHVYYWKLMTSAEREAQAGNTVRAAILRKQAARVAPAAHTESTRAAAEEDLRRLTQRLQAALQLTDEQAAEWLKDLTPLLDKADQGSRTVEAALLFDLQKVCLDHEREVYTLDPVEWLLTAGRRPIQRPLPSQRLVRINKHLRTANQRLTAARLSDSDREHLARLLQTALQQSSERLRARFRPVLTDALQDVGLRPGNPPERVAFHKMVEELLDRIAAYGFLTFSDLRDALSRNQLKLPDLGDPQEFIRGDPLLRLDRRLGAMLDGVYRPSEIYVRWLERLTALNFGTATGRLLTRYVTLPFGGAFVIQEGLGLILEWTLGKSRTPELPPEWRWIVFGLLGLFLFGLMHVPAVRRKTLEYLAAAYRGLHKVFVEWPARLAPIQTLHALVMTWSFQLFYWYVLKPLAICVLLWWWMPEAFGTIVGAVCIFVTASFVINSRLGQAVGEVFTQAAMQLYEALRAGLLPGLVRLIAGAFKQVLQWIEYVLFTVDEWLRFRSGDSQWSLAVRTALGLLWYPVSYVARFYMVVLVEPGLNPFKFPLSSVAAKIIYPPLWLAAPAAIGHLTPFVGGVLAKVLVVTTFFLLPDAFGFLLWEMKENWSLYRANRSPVLRPVAVGAHGETLRRLLQPGFHSGTVPRLYARLRQAERVAAETGNWRSARACRTALAELERSFAEFVDREILELLKQSTSWKNQPVSVSRVALSCNRLSLELANANAPGRPVRVEFEEQRGWLLASVPAVGWLDGLPPEPFHVFRTALVGLYKLAGVDLVWEQFQANLPPAPGGYEINPQGLVLWTDRRREHAIAYHLRDANGPLEPHAPDGAPAPEWPALDARRLVFAQVPVTWDQWVEVWQKDQDGKGHTPLLEATQDKLSFRLPGAPMLESSNGTAAPAAGGESIVPA